MLRTVPPHDLTAACYGSGIDLCDLAELTGISERDLVSFSEGRLALSACDRLVIIVALSNTMPEGWEGPRAASDPRHVALSLAALKCLREEAEAEERRGGVASAEVIRT